MLLAIFPFSLEKRNLRIAEIEEVDQEDDEVNIEPPKFSKISGFYPNDFKLKLISEENTKIYYTLDSTDPRNSTTSKEFTDYIQVYDRSVEPNVYSAIGINQTSPVSIGNSRNYKVPFYPVDKAMIIRAVAKNKKGKFSEVITKTYFVTSEVLYKYQDLTVISIVTDPNNLFDPDIGIYVSGTKVYEERKKNEAEGREGREGRGGRGGRGGWGWGSQVPANYQNKGKEWEREAFVTIFDKGEIYLQQNMGIRIKGAATRNSPGKSFNLFARKDYGKSRIETNILKDNYNIKGKLINSYKSLSLRSIYSEERLLDEFGRDLFYVREGLATPSMKNAILFLDGEYWGFYLIQEKIDDHFLSNNYLLPNDLIVVVKANKIDDGPEEEFNEFNSFCDKYSLEDVSKEEVYSEVKKKIDIDSFIDLYVTGIYIMHFDWPGNNDGSWKYIGDPIEGNKYSDGRWRFIVFDLDYSMGKDFFNPYVPDFDMFTYIESRTQGRWKASSTTLFINLINNNIEFQNKFINTVCDNVNDVYTKEKVESLVKKYKDECSDIVAASKLRWSGYQSNSVLEGISNYKTNYYKSLDAMKEFFENRPKNLFQNMKEYLGLKGEPVDLDIEIIGIGKVQVNSIIINPNYQKVYWTGKYFTRIPITIKAIPEEGYKFIKWTGDFESTKQNEEIVLFESQKITVIFD